MSSGQNERPQIREDEEERKTEPCRQGEHKGTGRHLGHEGDENAPCQGHETGRASLEVVLEVLVPGNGPEGISASMVR